MPPAFAAFVSQKHRHKFFKTKTSGILSTIMNPSFSNWIKTIFGITHTKPVRVTQKRYATLRKQAKLLVVERLNHFNTFYQFPYRRIFIKNQKTRWGSCSGNRNLNFNYRILFLPPHLQDYLIVHELCHLQQMNHSQAFWDLVGQQIPEYKPYSKELRTFRMSP